MYRINQTLRMPAGKLTIIILVLHLLWVPLTGYTQTDPQSGGQNQPTVYAGVVFIKLNPRKPNLYQQLTEKYGKRINEYFYKNENLLGWYLYKILLPSGTSADYDYAAVNITPSLSALIDPPGNTRELFKKIFPEMSDKMITDLMARYDSSRIVVRREVFVAVPGVGTYDTLNPGPARYMKVDMMDPAEGKTMDYIKMERETFLPVHMQRIKSGHLRNWGLYERLLPDERSGFEFVAVNFFDDLDKMDGGYEDAFKQVAPQTNMNTLMNETEATRDMVRSELWKLMYYVDRSNTKK